MLGCLRNKAVIPRRWLVRINFCASLCQPFKNNESFLSVEWNMIIVSKACVEDAELVYYKLYASQFCPEILWTDALQTLHFKFNSYAGLYILNMYILLYVPVFVCVCVRALCCVPNSVQKRLPSWLSFFWGRLREQVQDAMGRFNCFKF